MRDIVLLGDVLEELRKIPDGTVQCCVTSPPYWGLRDYGHRRWYVGNDPMCEHPETREHDPHHPGQVEQTKWKKAEAAGKGQTATTLECLRCGAWYGQLGLEPTPQGYMAHLVEVFREVRRVLREDGTLWLNLGDSWIDKQLAGIPWRVAFALQDDGWYLRSDIIWSKGNCMPESVRDRPTRSHEYVFLLSKNSSYFYDHEATKEPVASTQVEATFEPSEDPEAQRNKRTVWSINSKPYRGAHFAVFPEELPETCIKAGTSEIGCCATCGVPLTVDTPACHEGKIARCIVLDPFSGSGTTLAVAVALRRSYLGIELNPEYHKLIEARMTTPSLGVYSPLELRDKQEEFDNLPWE